MTSCFDLWCKYRDFLETRKWATKKSKLFSHLYLLICPPISYLCTHNLCKMVTELLVVWIVGVVAFFVLWAVLLKVIRRISDRKGEKPTEEDDSTGFTTTP